MVFLYKGALGALVSLQGISSLSRTLVLLTSSRTLHNPITSTYISQLTPLLYRKIYSHPAASLIAHGTDPPNGEHMMPTIKNLKELYRLKKTMVNGGSGSSPGS